MFEHLDGFRLSGVEDSQQWRQRLADHGKIFNSIFAWAFRWKLFCREAFQYAEMQAKEAQI